MSKVVWTDDQQKAIDARGSSLLVSAAAGSGKTAVLVERLIQRITCEELDVTQFLIITYTKAAASQLRKKVTEALYKCLEKKPGDRHLQRQVALCQGAKISTVHSFCSWVLKNYGQSDIVPPGFRIFEEAESTLILKDLLNELIDEKYEERDPSFLALARYMSNGKSDSLLFSSILLLMTKSRSHPFPEKWLMSLADAYDSSEVSSFEETVWGREILNSVKKSISACLEMLSALADDLEITSELEAKYDERIREAKMLLEGCFSDDWDTLFKNVSSFSLRNLPPSTKAADKTFPNRISSVFRYMRETISGKKGCANKMQSESAVLFAEMDAICPIVRTLATLSAELLRRFSAEKLRRGGLDYSDLEHLCIELLVDDYDAENDILTPSEIGFEVSKNFTEILLDEFQDSNIIQDVIFRAVSKEEKNIVMVGDVKQSIYGFRLADPSIFMKKYKTFKRPDVAEGDEPRCITLSKNFRSRPEILHFANDLFSHVMSENLGGVDYTRDHHLIERDNWEPRDGMECEFCLVNYSRDEEKGAEAEARFTANKISELVKSGFEVTEKSGGKRPCRYSDFAVLFRSASTLSPCYEREFARLGIPYISAKQGGVLQKSEISAIVSFLSVIDNPTSDIPLLAVLKSPLFAFSADDLCEIKRERKSNFYYALESLSSGDEKISLKCREFLSLLKTLRTLSRGMSASALIWEIYNRTNALGMFGALPYGEERQRNLLEFYRAAENFEGLGYRGLYRFISHISRLSENGGDIPAPHSHNADAVTFMTMHKSKGLEFPVVFISNAIRSFNSDDIKSPVLVHSELGVGMTYRDPSLGVELSSVMRNAIAARIRAEQKSEEMRLLYVALTRAIEKMYITASFENLEKTLSTVVSEHPYPSLDTIELDMRNDAQLWFFLPLIRSFCGQKFLRQMQIHANGIYDLSGLLPYVVDADEIPVCDEEEIHRAPVSEVVVPQFVLYPHQSATQSRSKITATSLGSLVAHDRPVTRKRAMRPTFMREKSLSPSERGIALHMAMQFADFSKCETPDGAKAELSRLCDEKFLTKAQIDSIDESRISAFVTSETGRAMMTADKVFREFKFSVLLPADEILSDDTLAGEEVLLQGVIDMYFEKDGKITIVDFKTDRHRPEGETLEKYTAQLHAYKRALFEMTGKEADTLILYLANHNDCIEV